MYVTHFQFLAVPPVKLQLFGRGILPLSKLGPFCAFLFVRKFEVSLRSLEMDLCYYGNCYIWDNRCSSGTKQQNIDYIKRAMFGIH